MFCVCLVCVCFVACVFVCLIDCLFVCLCVRLLVLACERVSGFCIVCVLIVRLLVRSFAYLRSLFACRCETGALRGILRITRGSVRPSIRSLPQCLPVRRFVHASVRLCAHPVLGPCLRCFSVCWSVRPSTYACTPPSSRPFARLPVFMPLSASAPVLPIARSSVRSLVLLSVRPSQQK